MKVTINVDHARGPNPEFRHDLPVSAANRPERDVPRGTVIDHPDAWMLCLGSSPVAEPADDEARASVDRALAERDELKAAIEAASPAADDETVESSRPRSRRRSAD